MGLSMLLEVNNKHRKWLDTNYCKRSKMSFTTQINIFPREWLFIEGNKSSGERTGTFSCSISLDPFWKCEMEKWWQIHTKQLWCILLKCVFIYFSIDSKDYILGLDLCGKVLVVEEGDTGVTPVRSCQKLSPCLTEEIPDGSKTDPGLDKAEPISDSGSTSGINYLRSGKKSYTTAAGREEWEYVRWTALQTTRSVQKEEVLQEQELYSPAASGKGNSEAGCLTAAYGGSHMGAGGFAWMRLCHDEKPALEQAPGKTCISTEKEPKAGEDFLAALATSWETQTGAVCSSRTALCGRNPH